MAGCVVRARAYTLLFSSGLAGFGPVSNGKCLFQYHGYKFRVPRPFFTLTRERKGLQCLSSNVINKHRTHVSAIVDRLDYFSTTHVAREELGVHKQVSAYVVTDSDADVHELICRFLVDRETDQIKKLRLEIGLDFDLDIKTNQHGKILVIGTDSEVLKTATARIRKEVQKIRNCVEKVYTDEDIDINYGICGAIIGKGGRNLQKLKSDTGLDFELFGSKTGLFVIGTSDPIILKSATEKVKREVQKLRNRIGKVFTDEDIGIHSIICGAIIGKGGQNIQRLKSEMGLDFKLYNGETETGLLVIATDAEMLKIVTEKVTQEVKRMRNCIQNVFIDEDVDINETIYRKIIGKGGQNIQRMRLETGLYFEIFRSSTGLFVTMTDAELLKIATEKVAQEIQRIRKCIESVFIDEDVDIHGQIFSKIIGKGGQNIQRMRLETGLDFETFRSRTGLFVSVTDVNMIEVAAEKVTQEVKRMRNCITKVFTDEDADIHEKIYGKIIGKGGQNIQRMKLESGFDFEITSSSTGILVSVNDAEMLKKAAQAVTQEVDILKNNIEFRKKIMRGKS